MPDSNNPQDPTIVKAAIHPAVGVARVGNSQDEYYIGPEVYPTPVLPPGSYRDGTGALKRQAARFRIYGYNAAGEAVGELTPDQAEIRWSVHVANHKASWYDWIVALDIPEAAKTEAPRRNAKIEGADRKQLVIDGGRVSIQGKDSQGGQYAFLGRFQGTEVYLGELRIDDVGHLLFLPGHGVSASPHNTPIYDDKRPNAFINADGWHDDVCDGPVNAEVKVNGKSIPCEPAWALSAPPDYAPNVVGVRTLYDLLYDLYVRAGWLDFPEALSFRRDIYPILHRLTGLGWVNKGFEVQFGLSGPYPFSDSDFLARLASNGEESAELRRQVFNNFRDPEGDSPLQLPWAWIYGDYMQVPAGDSPRQNAAFSPTQYRVLKLWAAGQFESDWQEPCSPPKSIGEVPLAQQPGTLDQAALEYCLADAFHPGCEVTWPVRHLTMWTAPFRLKHRPEGTPPPDYGPVMNQKIALSAYGPLYAQGPGDLTRWMGLPWQADTAYCRSGYDPDYDPYIPTFWPATVPNHVLTPEAYKAVLEAKTPAQREAAFARRFNWDDPLSPDGKATTSEQMKRMVETFGSMGFLEVRPGPQGDPAIPEELMVASFGPGIKPAAKKTPKVPEAVLKVSAAYADADRALREASAGETNWGSADEAGTAPLPVQQSKKR
ncbi:MAG TPA: LodA/GoxA family CTQ-dependent oxidase [Acidobacteriota bacterium]|nr:LodA/GoxA family CTQ-dependent oxidase [Acidobacteriota bacterium]